MEKRKHNTRHAAALAAAAALNDSSIPSTSTSNEPRETKQPSHSTSSSSSLSSSPPSSACQSPIVVKPQQSNRKTPSSPEARLHFSKMTSKRDMYDAFQAWALKTYGDSAKTKTVTRRKYNRILKILKGEEQTNAENSKFRFWVKAKGFRIGPPGSHTSDTKRSDQVLYIPCPKIQTVGSGKVGTTVYKKVAVVENFFDIIYGVHVEMDGRGGKHAGQKRTYKAIAEMYSFLPREAVTHFLMSCADCQKRMHIGGGGETKSSASVAASCSSLSHHGNAASSEEQQEDLSGGSELSSSPDEETESSSMHIDYNLPITTTYMRTYGYPEEDALNPEREDSEDAESEVSEDPSSVSNQPASTQQYDVKMEEGTEEPTLATETTEETRKKDSGHALDMRQGKQENGHVSWSVDEPINMTKGDVPNSHHDHSYERTADPQQSPCNGCVKRETSATPDNLSAGTKDDDDDEDDDDPDKIDINKYDPERLKAFNMFVRLFVDENLDRMVPISRQPKDKIQAIIDSCTRQFPEFGERARKRIRTYLKSCRRNKRTRENSNYEMGRSTHPHLTSALAEQILASACENESQNAKRMRLGLKPIPAEIDRGRSSHASHTEPEGRAAAGKSLQSDNILQATLRHGRPSSSATTTTSMLNGGAAYSQGSPTYNASYRFVPNATTHSSATSAAQSSSSIHSGASATLTNGPTDLSMKKCGGSTPNNAIKYCLHPSEVLAVKQLIAGYRESAAFLLRSADELEQLILHHN